jgi:hypothetical protein
MRSRYDDPETGLYSEERMREVEFFIEDGYPDYKFGVCVPKAFAEERIKAGGFGVLALNTRRKSFTGDLS